MNKTLRNLDNALLLVGAILFVAPFFVPANFLYGHLGGSLRFGGLTSIFLCPIIGLLGIILTLKEYKLEKKGLLLAFAIILLSFPISYAIGYFFQ